MFTLSAAQIKWAIEDAKNFNIEELIEGANKIINKQLKRGLIEKSEAERKMSDCKKFYEQQQSEAKKILELVEGFNK